MDQPSLDAMKAAVELEIENAIGRVTTRSIGALIDKVADARVAAAQGGTQAAHDVLAERRRQAEAEGWTPEHDDGHAGGDLAAAAACYAWSGGRSHIIERTRIRDALTDRFGSDVGLLVKRMWPWDALWWKPSENPRRDLVKAGALILAEIERLDRASS